MVPLLSLAACLVDTEFYLQRRQELLDSDGDGYVNADWVDEGGTDCDDQDGAVHPGADEVPYDGADNDCDPATLDDDLDQDGHGIETDCDDGDGTVHPDAVEVCDQVDNDCDGVDACLPQGLVSVDEAPIILRDPGAEGVETATGARLAAIDLDGDGLDDLVVASPLAAGMAGRVDVVTGLRGFEPGEHELPQVAALTIDGTGEHELPQVAALTIDGTGGPGLLGASLAGACDVDGDGFDDLVLGSGGESTGRVALFYGGPLGASGALTLAQADWSVEADTAGTGFGAGLACGPLDADGQAELLVGEHRYEGDGGSGRVLVYAGGPREGEEGPGEASLVIEAAGDVTSILGTSVSSGGDVNGDGVSDLAFSDPGFADNAGRVWVDDALGARMEGGGIDVLSVDDMAWHLGGGEEQTVGRLLALGGDLTGDGLDDLVLGGPSRMVEEYNVWLVDDLDAAEGTVDDAVARWTLTWTGDDQVGAASSQGDVDGDGQLDLVLGDPGAPVLAASGGAALLYPGGAGLLDALDQGDAQAVFASDLSGGYAGAGAVLFRDATGDGYGDVAVGAPELGLAGGVVGVWWGGERR